MGRSQSLTVLEKLIQLTKGYVDDSGWNGKADMCCCSVCYPATVHLVKDKKHRVHIVAGSKKHVISSPLGERGCYIALLELPNPGFHQFNGLQHGSVEGKSSRSRIRCRCGHSFLQYLHSDIAIVVAWSLVGCVKAGVLTGGM